MQTSMTVNKKKKNNQVNTILWCRRAKIELKLWMTE
ncbi:MAG: hypothetical protein MRERV_2c099 [Mycoplasmataceae bacterium RV_VA103A]|nr:MAG: hypothetical protein MRERV_2c099 [Mycoplasmataceae bacterium RV_VA103A]